jgi:hypothetical protein
MLTHALLNDTYYLVGDDKDRVLSSKSMSFVPVTDEAYQAFLASGMHPKWSMTEDDLAIVLLTDLMPLFIGKGLTVDFVNEDTLSGVYPLAGASFDHIRGAALESVSFGLPLGLATIDVHDMNGQTHTFTADRLKQLYLALRDYTAQARATLTALAHHTLLTTPMVPWIIE